MTTHRREKTNRTALSASHHSATAANWVAAVLIALVPFQGFLTVWGASLGANYTLIRMWNDITLIILMGICLVWLFRDSMLRQRLKDSYVTLAVVIFVALQVCFMLRGLVLGSVGVEAALIGLALNVRGPLFLLSCLILVKYSDWPLERWLKVAFRSAIIVAAFAVLQWTVLPRDFLTHFGYGSHTILPYETINSNDAYIRVASTTRGVNPLGAYMAIMLVLLAALWKKLRPKATWIIIAISMVMAMFASFSRSAWLGCAAGLLFIYALRLKTRRQWLWAGGIALSFLVLLGVSFAVVQKNTVLQNVVLHTDETSSIKQDSNDARYSAFFTTIREVVHEPLGRGVGSAGPASIHNTKAEPRMAENYFLQITQETGWFGLFAYLAMLAIVGIQLWRLRKQRVTKGLLAAFIATVVINMLSFAWTDDTLAFTWFGLAGITIGTWMWRRPAKAAIIPE